MSETRRYQVQWQLWPVDVDVPLSKASGAEQVLAYDARDAAFQVETKLNAELADWIGKRRRVVIVFVGPAV